MGNESEGKGAAPPTPPDWRSADDLRVLVCGGRYFNDSDLLARTLLAVHHEAERGIGWIIHGDARGADTMADHWARSFGIAVEKYTADWSRLAKAAGPIRNRKMLDKATPHLVVAFPGGRGTADMVSRARRRGIAVIEVAAEIARDTSDRPSDPSDPEGKPGQ